MPNPDGASQKSSKVRWVIEYAAVRSFSLFLAILPFSARIALGEGLGALAWRADRRHREVALHNLSLAFPNSGEEWRALTAKLVFRHLGRILVEVLTQGRDQRPFMERTKIDGWEHLQAAQRGGKGYFLVSAHFGNWERVAHLQAAMSYPLWMVTRPLDNPFLEGYFAKLREGTGNRVVHKRNAIREMVRGLRSGSGIAILLDQNFGEPGGLFVPFFGRPAATTPALGSLATRLGVPVLPVFSFPKVGGGYRIVYGPAVPLPATGDPGNDALQLTREVTARIEEAVRSCPEAWFWVHRRWRTRPEGEIADG